MAAAGQLKKEVYGMKPKRLTAERFVDTRTGCSYRYVYSTTEYFRPHNHDYFEIFLLLSGHAVHLINGEEQKLAPGMLVLIRPFDLHDYRTVDGQPFSMLNITFTQETCQTLFTYLGLGFPNEALLEVSQPPTVQLTQTQIERLESQMAEIRAVGPENSAQLQYRLRCLLFRLFTRYFGDSSPDKQNSAVPDWLEALCEQMQQNGNFMQGSSRLFALTDRSREHVSRCMKKYIGMTVSEYINHLRLNYIANTLLNSNHTITDIVYASGFNNLSWANTQFRKKYHMSMSEYRRSHE